MSTSKKDERVARIMTIAGNELLKLRNEEKDPAGQAELMFRSMGRIASAIYAGLVQVSKHENKEIPTADKAFEIYRNAFENQKSHAIESSSGHRH